MVQHPDRLRRYFAPPAWKSSLAQFERSGFALARRVLALGPRFVVDAGCGYNEFKGRIGNLLGIDLVNPSADWVCSFEEAPLVPGSIDVVLALGSINFGGEAEVLSGLTTVAGWLSPGGTLFMRGNPGEPLAEEITVFPWSAEAIVALGRRAGLALASEIEVDRFVAPGGRPGRRLVWAYRREPVNP
jgi:hypothetical protein